MEHSPELAMIEVATAHFQPSYARALTTRGNARRALGDYHKALGDLNRALELEPDNAVALCHRGATR